MERRKALRICVRRKWRKSPAFGVAPGEQHSPLGCGRAGGVGVAQSTQEGTEGFESLRRREDIEELKEQKKKRKWKRGRVLQVNLIILVLGSLFVPLTNSYICNSCVQWRNLVFRLFVSCYNLYCYYQIMTRIPWIKYEWHPWKEK